jgi:hypothetical protein
LLSAAALAQMYFMDWKVQFCLLQEIVERDGEIGRNKAISMSISRLSAKIRQLRKLGYRFEAKRDGTDYVYRLVERPERVAASRVDIAFGDPG